jgi:hypothetical protein
VEEEVHAEREDDRLGAERRRDQERGDDADDWADDRDRLGERGDQREQERRGEPDEAVGDARGDADRGHQDQLAADPEPEARLDLVPRIADAAAAVHRQEREGVPLEARSLGEPEEDQRQQGDEGRTDLADHDRAVDDRVRAGRRAGLEGRLHGVDEVRDPFREGLRPQLRAPGLDLVQERRHLRHRRPELDDRGGHDEYRDPDHRGQEDRIDDQDREAPTDPGSAAHERDDGLQGRPEQDGDEHEQEDVARERRHVGEQQDKANADRQADAARRPAQRFGTHPTSRSAPAGCDLRVVADRADLDRAR